MARCHRCFSGSPGPVGEGDRSSLYPNALAAKGVAVACKIARFRRFGGPAMSFMGGADDGTFAQMAATAGSIGKERGVGQRAARPRFRAALRGRTRPSFI